MKPTTFPRLTLNPYSGADTPWAQPLEDTKRDDLSIAACARNRMNRAGQVVLAILLSAVGMAQDAADPDPSGQRKNQAINSETATQSVGEPGIHRDGGQKSESSPEEVGRARAQEESGHRGTREGKTQAPTIQLPQRGGAGQGSRRSDALPWGLAVVMAVLAGAGGAYAMMLRRQDRHFSELREKVIAGGEPVLLLSEEAVKLIGDLRKEIGQGTASFTETAKDQRKELEEIVDQTKKSIDASKEESVQTVTAFKASLNDTLGKLGKFMDRVLQDTGATHSQSRETKEFAKQVSELIHAKEEEITRLKEGYHLRLIAPLVKAFLKIRDDVSFGDPGSDLDQFRQYLARLDQQIGSALADLKIEEIPIKVGENPHETHHSTLWETLGAPELTDDPGKHGTIARIHERGYQIGMTDGNPHVIRRTVVVMYRHVLPDRQPEVESTPDGK